MGAFQTIALTYGMEFQEFSFMIRHTTRVTLVIGEHYDMILHDLLMLEW